MQLNRCSRQALRHRIGDAALEDSVDVRLAQHLTDMPLMEALLKHAQRTNNEDEAEWHILDVTPFTSFIVGSVGLLGGTAAHYERMGRLARSLSTNRAWKASKPFLVLQPFYIMERVLGRELGNAIRHRARTIVATTDKSARSLKGNEGYSNVFMHALELPYVASPELAAWARACAHQPGGADRTAKRERGLAAASVSGATIELVTPTLLASCDTHDRDGRVTARYGFVFHGDMGRFDFGARAAVRDIAPHLIAPTSFSDARLTRAKEYVTAKASSDALNATRVQYDWYRTSSRGSSEVMLASSMCLPPGKGNFSLRNAS